MLLLELELELALTLRAVEVKVGDALAAVIGLEREADSAEEWSWEPFTAREGSNEVEAAGWLGSDDVAC